MNFKNLSKEFRRTDKLLLRILQWPFVFMVYLVCAPIAFILCIGVGLLWPIIGKDK